MNGWLSQNSCVLSCCLFCVVCVLFYVHGGGSAVDPVPLH